ncbi:MAG: PhnD/SsuA/transferrin family substrate-binding protein [Gammaproteobacteria bacterium]
MLNKLAVHILVMLLFLPTLAVADNASSEPIRLGSVAMDTPAIMQKRLRPLTQYLSEILHRPVTLKLSPDMPAAIKEVASGNVDVAYLTPVAYIRANAQGNTQLVAKTVTDKKASFQLMIVVRDDSPIKTVQDLADRRFAFGDRAALLQRAAVVGAGMPLDKLGQYDFLGHYDNIVRAVLYGDYDAGILKDTMAYKWEGKGIRILYRTPELPPYNIAASAKIDQQLLNQLRQAFLNLDSNNPDHHHIIKALDKKYDGFAPTSDAEYNIVRQLVKPFK